MDKSDLTFLNGLVLEKVHETDSPEEHECQWATQVGGHDESTHDEYEWHDEADRD